MVNCQIRLGISKKDPISSVNLKSAYEANETEMSSIIWNNAQFTDCKRSEEDELMIFASKASL